MRIFENRTTEIKSGNESLTYADLIVQCINLPQKSITTEVMQNRLDARIILNKIPAGKSIKIEEEIYDTIKDVILGREWLMVHDDIIALENHIKSLKKK